MCTYVWNRHKYDDNNNNNYAFMHDQYRHGVLAGDLRRVTGNGAVAYA